MKKTLICFMMLCSLAIQAKELTEVVEMPEKNKSQLYSSAREWFAEVFNSAEDVLQMDNPTLGTLIGKVKGSVVAYYDDVSIDSPYNYTIKISIKDGKYKYTIKDIVLVTERGGKSYEVFKKQSQSMENEMAVKMYKGILNSIDKNMEGLITNLKKKMKSVEDTW